MPEEMEQESISSPKVLYEHTKYMQSLGSPIFSSLSYSVCHVNEKQRKGAVWEWDYKPATSKQQKL